MSAKMALLLRDQIGSLLDVQDSNDPEGLRVFYYLIQDLKCFVFSLVNMHLKVCDELRGFLSLSIVTAHHQLT